MGALILQEVIKDLVELHGMDTASKLYLAGSRSVLQLIFFFRDQCNKGMAIFLGCPSTHQCERDSFYLCTE